MKAEIHLGHVHRGEVDEVASSLHDLVPVVGMDDRSGVLEDEVLVDESGELLVVHIHPHNTDVAGRVVLLPELSQRLLRATWESLHTTTSGEAGDSRCVRRASWRRTWLRGGTRHQSQTDTYVGRPAEIVAVQNAVFVAVGKHVLLPIDPRDLHSHLGSPRRASEAA